MLIQPNQRIQNFKYIYLKKIQFNFIQRWDQIKTNYENKTIARLKT